MRRGRPTGMKIAVAALALLTLASLTGCAGSSDQVATDPAGSSVAEPASTVPTAVPAAPGRVSTQGLVTVIDSGDGPQVCLGPTSRIYPPRCTGPALVGWTWDETAQQEGSIRFGSWALTGTWDGTELSLTNAIPAALYDAAAPAPVTLPTPSVTLSPDALAAVAKTLGAELPGVRGASPDDQGHVLVQVTYDDGSLQTWADQEQGAGVVVVQGDLVDAG